MIKTFSGENCVIKEVGDNGFGGYFSTKEKDRDGEIVQPHAFDRWIPQYLQNPLVFPGHLKIAPDGSPTTFAKTLRIRPDDVGAYAEFEYLPTDLAAKWKPVIKANAVRGLSHKSLPHDYENRRDANGGFVRVWKDLELVHIAVEPENSNRGALISKGLDETLVDCILKSVDQEAVEKQIRSGLERTDTALSVLGREFAELMAVVKGLASREDVTKAIEEFSGQLLDPDGVYARALANRPATDGGIDRQGSDPSVLQGLLAATEAAVKRK